MSESWPFPPIKLWMAYMIRNLLKMFWTTNRSSNSLYRKWFFRHPKPLARPPASLFEQYPRFRIIVFRASITEQMVTVSGLLAILIVASDQANLPPPSPHTTMFWLSDFRNIKTWHSMKEMSCLALGLTWHPDPLALSRTWPPLAFGTPVPWNSIN